MNIAGFCLNKKVTTLYLATALMIAGLLSYTSLGKLQDPEYTIKSAVVTTVYPGASALEVEQEVTDIVEEAIQKMGEVDKVRSLSRPGVSIIYVDIKDTYTAPDLPQIWDVLRRKVNDVQGSLPPGVRGSVVNDDFGDVYGQYYALVGDGYSFKELKAHADELKKQLLLVKGVGSVAITGDQPEGIYVEISRARLASIGVTPQQIYQVLNEQNTLSPLGQVKVDSERILINPNGQLKSVEHIGNLLISSGGKSFRLKDIANIKRDYVDPPSVYMTYNGKPALTIGVSCIKGGNVVVMGEAVVARLAELEEITPIGMELEPIYLQSQIVITSVNDFIINLLESLVIVVGVLVIFMGMKSSILIGIMLVLTIAATFLTMSYVGIPLQSVSLAAFIIALGMLVDNAIVVTEGVLIGVQKGGSGSDAAQTTIKDTMWPLLGATVIAVMAFSPVGLSPDSTGEFCKSLFQVMGISLLWSWVLAITVTPVLAVMMFKKEAGDSGDPYGGKFFSVYRTFLYNTLKYKKTVIMGLGVMLFLAVAGFNFVDKSFMPEDASTIFTVDLWRQEGSSIEDTMESMEGLSSFLHSMPEVKAVTSLAGAGGLRFALSYSPENPNSAYGQAIVETHEPDTVKGIMNKVMDYAKNNLPQAEIQAKNFSKLGGSDAKIQARFYGENPKVLRELAHQAETILKEAPNVGFVRTDWRRQVKTIRPQIHEQNMTTLGLSRPLINDAIQGNYQGQAVGVYRENNKLLTVFMRVPQNERGSADTLRLMSVYSPVTRKMVPLGSLITEIKTTMDDNIIWRRNRLKAMTAQADTLPGVNSTEFFALVRPLIEEIKLPPGYTLEWGGEYESSQKANAGIMKMLPISLIIMFSILVALFNSIKQPLVIVTCLPLALAGVTAGLLIFGKSFSFMALLGLLSLIGMLIKNAIVLIDQINVDTALGMAPFDAVMEAGVSRLRPVSMAAGTTVLGMIPLVNDLLFGPMAVTIMCGLAVATLLTLLVVPVFYVTFYGITIPEKV